MNQQVRAYKDEVLMAMASYDDWAASADNQLSLSFQGRHSPARSLEQSEERLIDFLKPLDEDCGGLPACLSPDRDYASGDDTADVGRLVRALYLAATSLYVYVDAEDYSAHVLLVGERDTPPHRYLLSISEEHVLELVADHPEDLRALYDRVTAALAQIG